MTLSFLTKCFEWYELVGVLFWIAIGILFVICGLLNLEPGEKRESDRLFEGMIGRAILRTLTISIGILLVVSGIAAILKKTL